MIKWKDLVDALGTDSEPPFSLDSEKELRKWCAEHFGVTYTAVYVWSKSKLPAYVRQEFVMCFPDRFHDKEYGIEESKAD